MLRRVRNGSDDAGGVSMDANQIDLLLIVDDDVELDKASYIC